MFHWHIDKRMIEETKEKNNKDEDDKELRVKCITFIALLAIVYSGLWTDKVNAILLYW